jgi:uncharacterized protein
MRRSAKVQRGNEVSGVPVQREESLGTSPMPIVVPEPTSDERTMALMAHLLQAFSGFIGPLVIFLVRPQSRFVKFHALQCLLWQAFYTLLVIAVVGALGIGIFTSVLNGTAQAGSQGPPPTFVYFIPVIWLMMIAGWLVNLTLGIVYGIKANAGEWAAYPLIGNWLRRKYAIPVQPESWGMVSLG